MYETEKLYGPNITNEEYESDTDEDIDTDYDVDDDGVEGDGYDDEIDDDM